MTGEQYINITAEEESLFREFISVYQDFKLLKEAGVFAMKNGHMIIHKDCDGAIRRVESMSILYKK